MERFVHNLPPVEEFKDNILYIYVYFYRYFVTLITRFFQEIIVHHAISIQ